MGRMVVGFLTVAALLVPAQAIASPTGGVVAQVQPTDTGSELVDSTGNGVTDGLEDTVADAKPFERHDVLVTFESEAAARLARGLLPSRHVEREFELISGFEATLTAAQIEAIAKLPGVLRVEENFTVYITNNSANADFGTAAARTDFGFDGSGVGICILDSGIDPNHEQFDDPGKIAGWFDVINGSATPYDDNGHGTHVAGTAAGEGTGGSIAASWQGVAPGASIYAGKVVSSAGSAPAGAIEAGIEWCVNQDEVRVISMSLGTQTGSDGLDTLSQAANAAVDAGKVVVVAAANNGDGPSTIGAPGAAEKAITIGAVAEYSAPVGTLWHSDGIYPAYFSSRGPTLSGVMKPDVMAPGVSITSADAGSPERYTTGSGTSMATPFAAGAVALAFQADPGLTTAQMKTLVATTAQDRGPYGQDNHWGWGLIDGYALVAEAAGIASYTPTAFPIETVIPGTVAAGGTWTGTFSLSAAELDVPIAATILSDGELECTLEIFGICLSYGWTPDLSATLYAPDGTVLTTSECPGGTDCGQVGQQETLDIMPTIAGEYTIEVTAASDAGGGFTVYLSSAPISAPGPDVTPPVITLVGPNPQFLEINDPYVELGATAFDNVDRDVTANVVIDASAVDTTALGSYPVTYNVSDSAGNAAVEVVRTVEVVPLLDTTPPVITLVGDNPQVIPVGSVYTELGATATDDVDGDLTGSIVIDATSVDTATVGSYSATYNVSDAMGNAAAEVVRTVDVVPPPPLRAYDVDFSTMLVEPFAGQDVDSTMAIEDDGASLRITGNGWKKISLPTEITPDTVVEFDYASTAEGEVQGVGFDTDEVVSSTLTFKVHGTQAWGIRDFDAYQPTAVTHYKIPVGAFYTGTYDFLIFANDHDVTPGTAESWFSNVKVYEEPAATDYAVDFSDVQVLPFGSNDVNSTMAIEDGGASLRVTGNGWKKLPIRTEVTPDTVLEFDFSSPAQAEVQGIGFDNDEGITSGQTFKVYGTQNWGIQTYADYVAPDVVHYSIPVGQYFTGTFKYLVFANDHDVASPTGESLFSNVTVSDGLPPDTTPPVITVVGANPLTLTEGDPYADPGATASDDVDGDLTSAIVVGGDVVDPDTVGTYVVTYDVSDAAGNAAVQKTRTVVVEPAPDTTPPVITLVGANPQTITVGDPYVELGATAVDDVDGPIAADDIEINATGVDPNTVGTYQVFYSAFDTAGNLGTATRTVEVVPLPDTTPPVITLLGDNPLTLTEGDPYTDPGATASDDVDGDLTSAIVVGGDTVDTAVPGTYLVTYNVSDTAGNAAVEQTRTVTVEPAPDTTPPVITVLGDNPLTLTVGDPYTDPGATASDDVDGDLTSAIVVGGDTVDTAVPGTYVVTYNVSDAAGNAAVEQTRDVVVLAAPDTTPPVITVVGANPLTLTEGDPYADPGATASDDVDGDLTSAIVVGGDVVDPDTVGTYVVTYDVSDAAGNAAVQKTRTVVVEPAPDTTPPVITLVGANPQTITVGDPYVELGATAVDDVDGPIAADDIEINATGVDPNTVGTYQVFYSAFDTAGNLGTATRTVEVVPLPDTTPPVITLLGDNPLTLTEGDPYTDPGATASDDVDGDLTSAIVVGGDTVDTAVPGTYLVTYNVSDTAGNAAVEQTRTVTVEPGTPSPTIDFSAFSIDPFGRNDVNSTIAVEDGGASLRVTGNGWKKIDLPTVITPDTVIEFDYASSAEGEVQGIGFDTNLSVSSGFTFKVHGTQGWGNRAFDSYEGPGVTHYKIPVGRYFTGSFDYLVFVNDHDVSNPTGESWFSNVEIYEQPPLSNFTVDFLEEPVGPFGGNDVNSTFAVEDGGASLRVTGNGWKQVALVTEITPDTVLEFDYSSTAQGEVQGIGFDNDQGASRNRIFKVYGTQNWGIQTYANYVGPGVTHYTIPIGQFYTGTFTYLVFANDHDVASPTGESLFSNVTVTTP